MTDRLGSNGSVFIEAREVLERAEKLYHDEHSRYLDVKNHLSIYQTRLIVEKEAHKTAVAKLTSQAKALTALQTRVAKLQLENDNLKLRFGWSGPAKALTATVIRGSKPEVVRQPNRRKSTNAEVISDESGDEDVASLGSSSEATPVGVALASGSGAAAAAAAAAAPGDSLSAVASTTGDPSAATCHVEPKRAPKRRVRKRRRRMREGANGPAESEQRRRHHQGSDLEQQQQMQTGKHRKLRNFDVLEVVSSVAGEVRSDSDSSSDSESGTASSSEQDQGQNENVNKDKKDDKKEDKKEDDKHKDKNDQPTSETGPSRQKKGGAPQSSARESSDEESHSKSVETVGPAARQAASASSETRPSRDGHSLTQDGAMPKPRRLGGGGERGEAVAASSALEVVDVERHPSSCSPARRKERAGGSSGSGTGRGEVGRQRSRERRQDRSTGNSRKDGKDGDRGDGGDSDRRRRSSERSRSRRRSLDRRGF